MTTETATPTTQAPGVLSRLAAVPGDALLRLVLKLDAAITGANGIVYIAAAGILDSALGYSQGVLVGAGAFLVAFAIAVLAIGSRVMINRHAVAAVVAANAAWALGSIALGVAETLTPTTIGVVWLIAQAGTVAGFAALQLFGLRRAGR